MAELFSVDDPMDTDAGYKLVREYIGTHPMTDLAKWLRLACSQVTETKNRDYTRKVREQLASASIIDGSVVKN